MVAVGMEEASSTLTCGLQDGLYKNSPMHPSSALAAPLLFSPFLVHCSLGLQLFKADQG